MIDDMEGLYTHASEAFRAGQRAGVDDFFRGAQMLLSAISVAHESEENPVAFHVAEECCKALRELKDRYEKRRMTV